VGCIIILVLEMMVIGLPGVSRGWQGKNEAEAAAEAEKAKLPERRDGIAEHIEVADESAPGERDNFKLRNVTYYSYDSQGRCTAMDRYDADGDLFKYEHYTYDGQGNRILEQSESPGLSWETYKEVRLTYDEENRLTLEQNYDGDVLSSEYYLRYMPDGSTSSVVQNYDKDGQKGSWSTTVFNGNGDPVSEYHYDAEGQVTSCYKYRYDEEGQQIYFICYNRGDETTKPLREVITEYGEDQAVRISYEPLGHLNSVHYVVTDENTKTEMYYLAGYSGGSGGDGIYILGQEEPKWNRELKFWEGLWQTCNGDDKISSLHCSYDRIHSYTACWYEAGNKVRELECSVDGGICITTMNRYVYNGDGTLAECYEYGFSGESLEEELQDGTRIRLDYEGSKLKRLLCTGADGIVLREITFDTEVGRGGNIEEWYEPLKEQMWAEALIPTEDGIVSAEQAGREAYAAGEEPEEGQDRGEFSDEISLPCYYEVEKGDSLWKIAGRIYGDPYRFVIIYNANKVVIGPDWNFIPAGMVLYLPEPDAL
ncbi:MAG: LysM peptidoglycan-binding domain-containing protein, partial [Acetatifactor sp.]|nr:LysM peptidoglycan-binding domain-containing protein [Acetatifactor sp.]